MTPCLFQRMSTLQGPHCVWNIVWMGVTFSTVFTYTDWGCGYPSWRWLSPWSAKGRKVVGAYCVHTVCKISIHKVFDDGEGSCHWHLTWCNPVLWCACRWQSCDCHVTNFFKHDLLCMLYIYLSHAHHVIDTFISSHTSHVIVTSSSHMYWSHDCHMLVTWPTGLPLCVNGCKEDAGWEYLPSLWRGHKPQQRWSVPDLQGELSPWTQWMWCEYPSFYLCLLSFLRP